ncbi:MAG: hypothetical protein ACRC9Z_10465 [Weissella confusa]
MISIKDDNHIPQILVELHNLEAMEVHIGIFGGGDIAMIAGVQEFGAHITPKHGKYLRVPTPEGFVLLKSVDIPSRSFIRSTFAEKQGEWLERMQSLIIGVATGKLTAEQAYMQIGERIKGDIQNKIITLQSPANAALTIANKGSSNPLVDTGNMLHAVTYRVVGK